MYVYMYMVQVRGTEYSYRVLGTWFREEGTEYSLVREICSFATKPNHISNFFSSHQTKQHQ